MWHILLYIIIIIICIKYLKCGLELNDRIKPQTETPKAPRVWSHI